MLDLCKELVIPYMTLVAIFANTFPTYLVVYPNSLLHLGLIENKSLDLPCFEPSSTGESSSYVDPLL